MAHKGNKQNRKARKDRDGGKGPGGVSFELEADAEQIFREYLEKDDFSEAKDDTDGRGRKPAGVDGASQASGGSDQIQIDLHGLNLEEAKAVIERRIAQLTAQARRQYHLRIITGKGRHSEGGAGVLVREIYDFFVARWRPHIIRIDSPPANDLIGGLPWRGHFDVVFF